MAGSVWNYDYAADHLNKPVHHGAGFSNCWLLNIASLCDIPIYYRSSGE